MSEDTCPCCSSADVFILRNNHHVCSQCSHNWGRVDAEGNPTNNPTFIAGMDKSAIAAYLTPEILDRIRRDLYPDRNWRIGEIIEDDIGCIEIKGFSPLHFVPRSPVKQVDSLPDNTVLAVGKTTVRINLDTVEQVDRETIDRIIREHEQAMQNANRAVVDRLTVNGQLEGSGQNPKMEVSWDQTYDPVGDLSFMRMRRLTMPVHEARYHEMQDRQRDDEARYHQKQIDNLIRATSYDQPKPKDSE